MASVRAAPKVRSRRDGAAIPLDELDKRLLNLMEGLEEMDDVAKVFSNFDIDAEAMAAVTG